MSQSLYDLSEISAAWESLTYEQKNHQLYLKEKNMLGMFQKQEENDAKKGAHRCSFFGVTDRRLP